MAYVHTCTRSVGLLPPPHLLYIEGLFLCVPFVSDPRRSGGVGFSLTVDTAEITCFFFGCVLHLEFFFFVRTHIEI